MRVRAVCLCFAVAAAGLAVGCGQDEAREEIKEAAEVVGERPKDAIRVYEETYEEDRKKGEGRVEAAGDAYEAVLEVPKERAEAGD